MPALFKLFFLFSIFDSVNCKRVRFFPHPSYHLRKLNVFSNDKTSKSRFIFLLIASSVTVYLNQMIELSVLPFGTLTFSFTNLIYPWCALFAFLDPSYSPFSIKKEIDLAIWKLEYQLVALLVFIQHMQLCERLNWRSSV